MSANITKKISAGFNLMTTLHLPPLFQLPFGQSQFLGLAIYCLGQKIQEPDLWPFMNSNCQFYKVAVRSNYTEKIDLLGKIWNGANDNNDIKKTGFFSRCSFLPNKCDNLTKEGASILRFLCVQRPPSPPCPGSNLHGKQQQQHHRKFWPFLG